MKPLKLPTAVALMLGTFLIHAPAQAMPGTQLANSPEMTSQDLQQAANEWETILQMLDAGSDQSAGPGGRVTVCSMTGMASFYGPGLHGRKTASGEVFNANGITAAHRSLPFGTQVRVTSLATGRTIIVRINDRGPFAHGRIIDLSAGAARAIGLSLGQVRLECV